MRFTDKEIGQLVSIFSFSIGLSVAQILWLSLDEYVGGVAVYLLLGLVIVASWYVYNSLKLLDDEEHQEFTFL